MEENNIFETECKPTVSYGWKCFALFLLGIIIGFVASPVKNGVSIGNNNNIVGKDDLREMAFVGVRRDESLRRSEYDFTSYGTKHKGQYSCNPVLDWSSAEIFLYIYEHKLQ